MTSKVTEASGPACRDRQGFGKLVLDLGVVQGIFE
jgi:hypothetical protein